MPGHFKLSTGVFLTTDARIEMVEVETSPKAREGTVCFRRWATLLYWRVLNRHWKGIL